MSNGDANNAVICSDPEGQPHGGDKSKRKDRPKIKRKKTHEHEKKMPRLAIIGIEQEAEVVECQMETAKHSAVTFKFNYDTDQPSEIANNLVSCLTLPLDNVISCGLVKVVLINCMEREILWYLTLKPG